MKPGVNDDGPTVFVHVPRTAGTSFTKALFDAYVHPRSGTLGNAFKGRGGIDREKLARRTEEVWRAKYHGRQVLHGHSPFGMIRPHLPRNARYVTFLRDPVERTLSHYENVLRVRSADYLVSGRTVADLLAEGEYLQPNLQTRMLCDDPQPFGEVTEEMLDQAKANLAGFGFVGFGITERYADSLALLGSRLGVAIRPSAMHERAASAQRSPGRGTILSVQRFNELDAELYRWASARFERDFAELRGIPAGVA